MDLKLPNLGEGADSGTVVNVFVKEGDQIAKDQAVLELENEKAVATIPSSVSGTVSKLYVKAGDKISVGQRILTVGNGGAEPERAAPQPAQRMAPAPPPEDHRYHQEPEPRFEEEPADLPDVEPAAAPSIRKLARDLGIDLSRIRGTARGGRIVLEDVRAYIQRLQRIAGQHRGGSPAPAQPQPAAGMPPAAAQPAPAAPAPAPAPAAPKAPAPKPVEQIDFSKWGPVKKQPVSPLRQVIARRMHENWNAVPHVTQFDEVDITRINAFRKHYGPAYEQKGARLTLTSFALKALADTLRKHPIFNSSLDESSQEIVLKQYYHIGIAVDTEAGLIVPVIRDVDKKSILQLSLDLEEIARKARERKVTAEELKGGTFTISNQGGIGGGHFTPIVNKPEVAILGLGRAAIKPVVRENAIEARLMMPLGLSYDHRVIDGGSAARFTVDLVKAFEDFKEEAVRI